MAFDPDEIRAILDLVKLKLDQPDMEVFWTGFKTPEDLRSEFLELYSMAISGDQAATKTLHFWFAATGPLQETSIDNGWGDEFLVLAKRFDRATGNS